MTIQSLQKIISLEEELFAAEQAEREETELWLKDQCAEILRYHDDELSSIKEKQEKETKRFIVKANKEASARLQVASDRALYVDRLDDAVLTQYLVKILKIIIEDDP